MGRMRSAITKLGLLGLLVALGPACKDSDSASTPAPTGAGSSATPTPPANDATTTSDDEALDPRKKKPEVVKDLTKGDGQDDEWVPAEFKKGAARWKDVGVYLDGKALGFLSWGELPIALEPTWVQDKVSAEKRPGTDDPGWRWAKQRFYRFDHYLRALGVDIKRIKELHVYGPKFSATNISTAKDLLGPKGKDFMFRFGANTRGKPIGAFPPAFGNGVSADKIAAVMIYIKKRPPKLVRNEGLVLDGVLQSGVPYFGEPIRGGVRVYLDDKLAAIIKRQELDVTKAVKNAEGELTWKLTDVLAAQGVDLGKVAELWAIRNEKREEKFPSTDLAAMTFTASSQAKGGILLTPEKIRASVLALHSRPVKPEQLPTATPDDE